MECMKMPRKGLAATAIGNVMMQAVAAGDVATIAEARDVIRRSFPVDE